MENKKFYTLGEEIANAVTHGIGTLLAIAALVLLIVFSARQGDAWYVFSFTIFGCSLVVLYLCSTLYHSIPGKRSKKVFRIFDHASIYILIAGTYTPFALTILRNHGGWVIFGIAWSIAVVGIIMKVFWTGRFQVFSTILYIAMGWMIIFYVKTLIAFMPATGLMFLVAGGIIYTLGAVLFLFDKIPFNHAVWHVFVIGGSTCHFFSVLLYLLHS